MFLKGLIKEVFFFVLDSFIGEIDGENSGEGQVAHYAAEHYQVFELVAEADIFASQSLADR